MEDYIHLLIVMFEFAPDILFVSPAFPEAFRANLSALTMYHIDIVWPAIEFLTGVLQHDCLRPETVASSPTFPLYATAIRAVVESQGFAFIGLVLSGLLTNFDETTSIAATVLIKSLAELFPQQVLGWLSSALDQLVSPTITPASKAALLSEFAK